VKELIYLDKDRKERIDAYLKRHTGISREKIKELVNAEKISVNGKRVTPSYLLRHNDRIKLAGGVSPPGSLYPEAQQGNLDILHEDDDVIVVNKPAGIITHPAPGTSNGTLVNYVLSHTKLSCGLPERPGVVHRLDRETSGVIVFAKTEAAFRGLVQQFKNRQVEKEYIALVKGFFSPPSREIEFTVCPDKKNRTAMEVHYLRGKKAVTRVESIKHIKEKDITLVRAKPVTGRMHQVRLALSSVKYPIIGDARYGIKSSLIDRVALHAHKIAFRHPVTGERLSFVAPVPADLAEIIKPFKLP